MILVTGASRSGKTSTLKQLVALEPGWEHVVASRVLRQIGCPLENLSLEEAVSNQKLLIRELALRGQLREPNLLLDGHAVLEVQSKPVCLKDEVFDALNPDAVVVIYDSIQSIQFRRRKAGRGELSLQDISHFQKCEIEHSKSQSERLNVPCALIESGDVAKMSEWIQCIRRQFLS
ncbi:AAA family ATPase [Pelagimonas varians]|uniref:Adenylate kinase n=1 Tax=Pelagimonas varians TaxID=696760 RepID=A0A238KCW2_9RHOB|nr:AAA family ATPase [Pelagimonas varians]PYG29952.1 AAA domain-containing protein [Pelagimonas varians]SMX40665.1 hypothetical protein PEV8663_02077 [Pelagimonas varians]